MASIEENHEPPPIAPPLAVLKSHAADIQAAIAEYELAKMPDDKARAVTKIAGAAPLRVSECCRRCRKSVMRTHRSV